MQVFVGCACLTPACLHMTLLWMRQSLRNSECVCEGVLRACAFASANLSATTLISLPVISRHICLSIAAAAPLFSLWMEEAHTAG